MLFVNGELRIIYTNADKSVIKKVEEAFMQIGYRYDFDHARLKNGVKINGWGMRAIPKVVSVSCLNL